MTDSIEQIAIEAIDALDLEEGITESQFGIGVSGEDYHEKSKVLRARLNHLKAQTTVGEFPDYDAAKYPNLKPGDTIPIVKR